MLGSQAEPRPSADRAARDGGYESSNLRQQNYQSPPLPPNATYANRNNSLGPNDAPRQRAGAPGGGALPPNGMNPPNNDARSPRDRIRPQENSTRDPSRPRGTSSGKKARICAKCGQNLTGQFVRALDATYHLECFLCRVGIPEPYHLRKLTVV